MAPPSVLAILVDALGMRLERSEVRERFWEDELIFAQPQARQGAMQALY